MFIVFMVPSSGPTANGSLTGSTTAALKVRTVSWKNLLCDPPLLLVIDLAIG